MCEIVKEECKEIEKLCKRYKFSHNMFYNKVYVSSKFDEWYFVKEYEGHFLLYHKTPNSCGSSYCRKSRNQSKEKWHLQERKFYDVAEIIKYLNNHDIFSSNDRIHTSGKLLDLFEKIKLSC